MIMKTWEVYLLAIFFALLTSNPVHALGMYGSSPCQARDPLEAYCVSRGGCPSDGYCHFPDGSYCELGSFYNGTCPERTYYEQAIWMNEAYSFLYDDRLLGYPYAYYQYPPPYPYYPYYLGPDYVFSPRRIA